jgi:hypothetical protein
VEAKVRLLFALLAIAVATPSAAKCPPQIEANFKTALTVRDEARIYAATAAARVCSGDPKPEAAEKFIRPKAETPPVLAKDRRDLIKAYFDRANRQMWWLDDDPPTAERMPAPLRVPSSVVRGAAMASSLEPALAASLLDRYASRTVSFLMAAQSAANTGVFPTPAREGPSDDRVFQLTDKFVKDARKRGDLGRVVRDGWIIDDRGGGDLQYDNGLAGEALLAYYALRTDPDVLSAAIWSGEWAMTQPMSANFNYNGFTAALLARLFAVTKDDRYRREAVARIRLGVLPGMISDGPFAGHWIDPHNERLVYRMIMVRQMFAVVGALPKDDPDRAFISARAAIAKRAIEAQLAQGGGIAHPGTLMTMYCDDPGAATPEYSMFTFAVQGHIAASLLAGEISYDPHAAMCALEDSFIEIQFQENKARP